MDVTVSIYRTRTGLGHPETAALVKKAAAAVLMNEGIDVMCRVDVMLTDDETIHNINRENRGVDRATDVLSFPLNELTPGKFDEGLCEKNPGTGEVLLGDMVISIPRCEKQGEEYGHGYRREVCYLAVHSMLHLLGYDHVDEGDEKRIMRSREDAVMEKLGIGR
ncbi:MAG: rRNA maturation RNase YbeY [Oscillospiraceae bacterium]